MALTFFKPNKSSKGALLNVNFVAKADKVAENGNIEKGDKSFYFRFVGQKSWDDKSKTGSFKDGPTIVAKMSPNEVAGIVYSIRNNVSLEKAMNVEYIYHDSEESATIIGFNPHFKRVQNSKNEWVESEDQVGYALRVTKKNKSNADDKLSLGVGFTFAEAELFAKYLDDGLSHICNALYSEDVSRFKDKEPKEKRGTGGRGKKNAETKAAEPEKPASPPDDVAF